MWRTTPPSIPYVDGILSMFLRLLEQYFLDTSTTIQLFDHKLEVRQESTYFLFYYYFVSPMLFTCSALCNFGPRLDRQRIPIDGKRIRNFIHRRRQKYWYQWCDVWTLKVAGSAPHFVDSYIYLSKGPNMMNSIAFETSSRKAQHGRGFGLIREVTDQLKDPDLKA